VQQVIFGAPEAAMNIHYDPRRFPVFGETQIAELIEIGAVGEAMVGRWRHEAQDVFRHGKLSCHKGHSTRDRRRRGVGAMFLVGIVNGSQFDREAISPTIRDSDPSDAIAFNIAGW